DSQLDQKLKEWQAKMAKARGAKVIDYHRELTYFANRFGLKVVGYVEPKPGVPPTPSHTQDLIQLVRNQKVKAIVMEQWYNQSTPQLIQRETGMPYVVIPTSVGGEPGVDTYFELFDRIIAKLAPVLS
ncbi:MAG TPA: metal ABC transporter substrate-binding protein, partial [Stenomitos sp.]